MKIAAVGLTTYELLALRLLAGEAPCAIDVDAVGGEVFAHPGAYAGFAVSSDVLAHYADFLMPRRDRTLIIARTPRPTVDNPAALYADDSVAVAAETFARMTAVWQRSETTSYELSQRETEVLRLVATGLSNKEIADVLCISINTVITHRKNITAKLGIRTPSGLSLYALLNGLIPTNNNNTKL